MKINRLVAFIELNVVWIDCIVNWLCIVCCLQGIHTIREIPSSNILSVPCIQESCNGVVINLSFVPGVLCHGLWPAYQFTYKPVDTLPRRHISHELLRQSSLPLSREETFYHTDAT